MSFAYSHIRIRIFFNDMLVKNPYTDVCICNKNDSYSCYFQNCINFGDSQTVRRPLSVGLISAEIFLMHRVFLGINMTVYVTVSENF